MFWVGILYFIEGWPFGLLNDALPVYLRGLGVNLETIGWLSVLSLPWSLKFFWSPLLDRITTRNHWLVVCIFTTGITMIMSLFYPVESLTLISSICLFIIAFSAATQDIAIDAYSISLLEHHELGTANGVRMISYRVALAIVGGGLVAASPRLHWKGIMIISSVISLILAALIALYAPKTPSIQNTLSSNLLVPIKDLMKNPKIGSLIIFVLLYRIGDNMAAPMTRPFFVDRGLSASEIGTLQGTIGILAVSLGALWGGIYTSRKGMYKALWVLGLAALGSNLGYAWAATLSGHGTVWTAATIEWFTAGLGTAAFLAFLMSLCDPRWAATQYAFLSTVYAIGRIPAGIISGYLTARVGYKAYFIVTFLIGILPFAFLPHIRNSCFKAENAHSD